MMFEPIEVEQLPQASTFLNYPHTGPAVGKYLGPKTMGEYFTVVSSEPEPILDADGNECDRRVRVGLAYGCYSIGGQPTDPDGFPAPVAAALIRRDWGALKVPSPKMVKVAQGKDVHR